MSKARKILQILQANPGKRFTAIQLGLQINSCDARARISELRDAGHPIKDVVINPKNGTKGYYYEKSV